MTDEPREPRYQHDVKRLQEASSVEAVNELLETGGWELLKISERSTIGLDKEAGKFQEVEPAFILGWRGENTRNASDPAITSPSGEVTGVLAGLPWKASSDNPRKLFVPAEEVPGVVKEFFAKQPENERKLKLGDGSSIYHIQHSSLLRYTRGGKSK